MKSILKLESNIKLFRMNNDIIKTKSIFTNNEK